MGRANFVCEPGYARFPDLAMDILNMIKEKFSKGGNVSPVEDVKAGLEFNFITLGYKTTEERTDVNENGAYHRQKLYLRDTLPNIFNMGPFALAPDAFADTIEETYSQWVNLNGQSYRVALWLDGVARGRNDRPQLNTESTLTDLLYYINNSKPPSFNDNEPIGVMYKSITLMLFNENGEALVEVPYAWDIYGFSEMEGFISADIHDDDYQDCLMLQKALDTSIFKGIHVACLDGLDPFPAEVTRGFVSEFISEQADAWNCFWSQMNQLIAD